MQVAINIQPGADVASFLGLRHLLFGEGNRRCPGSVVRRLRRAFPDCTLKIVWDNFRHCWAVLQKGRHTGRWIYICPWHREPTEELIRILQRAKIGGRGDLQDPVRAAIDDYHKACRAEERAQKRSRELARDLVRDTRFYVPHMLRGTEPLNPRYTHGFGPGRKGRRR